MAGSCCEGGKEQDGGGGCVCGCCCFQLYFKNKQKLLPAHWRDEPDPATLPTFPLPACLPCAGMPSEDGLIQHHGSDPCTRTPSSINQALIQQCTTAPFLSRPHIPHGDISQHPAGLGHHAGTGLGRDPAEC